VDVGGHGDRPAPGAFGLASGGAAGGEQEPGGKGGDDEQGGAHERTTIEIGVR
jgi:hypothetical protein